MVVIGVVGHRGNINGSIICCRRYNCPRCSNVAGTLLTVVVVGIVVVFEITKVAPRVVIVLFVVLACHQLVLEGSINIFNLFHTLRSAVD